MGNFFRRFLAFILGMIFGAVILSGTAIGVSYYVYKNVTLSDMGVNKDTTDLGELNDATIEEIIALVVSATNDPASYTFGDLEKNNGFSVEGFLTACGLDVSAMHPDDIESFKKVAPFTLFTENGFEKFANTVNMGVIFGLIPKTDGKYPIFSEGARAQLRSYKLSELIGEDANGNLKFVEVVLELPLGSVFSSVYTETYDTATATYAYTTDEGGLLDAVGSLSVNSFMALGDADIGYQFNEGEFVDLGSTTIGELFGLEDSGDALMQTISNKTIGDLFVKEGETYTFDVMALLNDLEVGTLMGMKKCVSATNCQLEHSTHQAGWYDASGTLIEDTDIAGQLMTNLYDLTVLDLTNGTFDVTGLTEGIYLGKALGLTIGNKAGYCQADCNDTTAGHKHKYYWVDNAGNYANAMNNALANISINDVMNGNLDIAGVIGDVKIGDFMGMTYCDGTSCDLTHTHQKGWYDASGNIVSGDDIAGELMLSLYDITVNNLISGTFDIAELTKGIYLGKAFGYKIGVKAGYCDVNCNDTTAGHKHNYYWVDNAGVFVGDMNNSLANVGLQDVMNGNLDIQGVLGGVKIGELMGMTYCDGTSCDLTHTHQAGWYDASGNKVNEEEIADDIMLGIYDKTVNDLINGNFDVAELTSGIYLGKALGYKIGVKAGYCLADCANATAGHKHEYYWVDSANVYVGAMNNGIANIALQDAMEGNLNFEAVIGGVKVGELMGMTYCDGTSCDLTHSHVLGWYNAGALVTDATVSDAIMLGIYDKTVNDLMNGNLDIVSLTSGIYLGKALGYKMSAKAGYCDINCTNTAVDHKHEYYWVDSANVYVGAMNNGIANIALQDAMNGSLNIEAVIGKLKLGEVMGKTFEGGKWYDNGTEIVYDNLKGTNKIIYNLYDTLLSDIMNGNFNIDSALNSLYVGELMNYEGGVGSWTKLVSGSYQSVSKIEGIIADIKMSDLLSGNVDFQTKINNLNLGDVVDVNSSSVLKLLSDTPIKDIPTAVDGLYIGDIMGYVKCTNDDASCPINVAGHVHDGKWYDASGNVVKGVYATISKYTIKGLTEGGLTSVKIGELIDTEGNAVLSLLANETLDTVGAKTNTLKLGEIMGYVKCTNDDASCPVTKVEHVHNGKWFDKSGNEVTGINQKMAGFTIQDVSDGKLGGSEFVNSLTVGDVITSNTGVFKIMKIGAFTVGEGSSAVSYNAVDSVSEVPVSEISARVTEGVKNATYAELTDAGINILSADNEYKINLFYLHKDKGVTDWQNKTIDEIISDIISSAIPTT